MSDEGVPCYRRMSAPSSAEELEEAAGLLRDAAGCVDSAAERMHYTEARQFGSVLMWCKQVLLAVSARLGERAERVRDQERREESFELGYVDAADPGVEIFTRVNACIPIESVASKYTDQ